VFCLGDWACREPLPLFKELDDVDVVEAEGPTVLDALLEELGVVVDELLGLGEPLGLDGIELVLALQVGLQVAALSEGALTLGTAVGPVPGVALLVHLEGRLLGEGLAAEVALEGPLARVDALVPLELAGLGETLAANVALTPRRVTKIKAIAYYCHLTTAPIQEWIQLQDSVNIWLSNGRDSLTSASWAASSHSRRSCRAPSSLCSPAARPCYRSAGSRPRWSRGAPQRPAYRPRI
jgi:hypothetical protein